MLNLEELMTNPYAWLILAVCTIFGAIYSFYASAKGKEKKEISYTINTYEIVRAGKNIIPEFEVLYRRKPVSNLTVSRIVIWNSGNRMLKSEDIVDVKPLSIISNDDGPEILDASIIKHSEEFNKFTVSKMNPHCAEIKFDYMDKQDGIILQILHTGSISDFTMDCKIKGGKKLRKVAKNNSSHKNKKNSKKFSVICLCIELITIVIMLTLLNLQSIGVISDKVFLTLLFLSPNPNPIVLVILMDVLAVIMGIMCYRLFRKVFHLDIPASLRDEVEYSN